MISRIKVWALVTCLLFAGGCSSTLKATKVDASGRFPTTTLVNEQGIKVVRPFQDKFKQHLYVKIDDSKVDMYRDFFVSSFSNANIFAKVSQKSDLEQLVIERKLMERVSSVSDLVGLNNLAKQVGSFLVVEPYVEWKGGYDYVASLKAIDPESGETVLHIEHKAFNWAGLDKPLFYPLFNAFIDWANGQQIAAATAPPPVTNSKRRKPRATDAS